MSSIYSFQRNGYNAIESCLRQPLECTSMEQNPYMDLVSSRFSSATGLDLTKPTHWQDFTLIFAKDSKDNEVQVIPRLNRLIFDRMLSIHTYEEHAQVANLSKWDIGRFHELDDPVKYWTGHAALTSSGVIAMYASHYERGGPEVRKRYKAVEHFIETFPSIVMLVRPANNSLDPVVLHKK